MQSDSSLVYLASRHITLTYTYQHRFSYLRFPRSAATKIASISHLVGIIFYHLCWVRKLMTLFLYSPFPCLILNKCHATNCGVAHPKQSKLGVTLHSTTTPPFNFITTVEAPSSQMLIQGRRLLLSGCIKQTQCTM